jgi:hypothetical protein
MIQFSTNEEDAPKRHRETLFTIDGRECTVPVSFEPIECARYAHMIEQFGGDQAGVWALRYALGDEDYLAFINLPPHAVSREDFTRVMGVITGRLVGLDVAVPKAVDGAPSGASSTSPSSTSTDAATLEPLDSEVWPGEEPEPGLTPSVLPD